MSEQFGKCLNIWLENARTFWKCLKRWLENVGQFWKMSEKMVGKCLNNLENV